MSAFQTSLFDAAIRGNLRVVQRLLDAAKVLTLKDLDGNTALHVAAREGHVEVVKALLEAVQKNDSEDMRFELLRQKNEQWDTALHVAAREGHVEVVKALLEAAGDIVVGDENKDMRSTLLEITNVNKETALHVAAREDHVEVIEALLKAAGDIKVRAEVENVKFRLLRMSSYRVQTALHVAAEERHVQIVKALLAAATKERDGEVKDIRLELLLMQCHNGFTVLQTAARLSGNVEVVKALLEAAGTRASELLRWDPNFRMSALDVATKDADIDVVRALLSVEIKFDELFDILKQRNGHRHTPLHNAIYRKKTEVVKALLDAAKPKAMELLKILIPDHRMSLMTQRFTALHVAARQGNVELSRALLEAAGQEAVELIEMKTDMSDVPLDLVPAQRPDMVRLFFDYGADLNATKASLNAMIPSDPAAAEHTTFYAALDNELRAALDEAGVHIPSMARWVDRRLKSPMNRLFGTVANVIARGRKKRPNGKRHKGEAESGNTHLGMEFAARSYLGRLSRFPRFKRPEVLFPAIRLLVGRLEESSDMVVKIKTYLPTSAAHRAPLRL